MTHHFGKPRRSFATIAALFGAIAAASAQAHVKWFTPTNGADAPRGAATVTTPIFLSVLAVSVMLVFLGFILDGWVARRWPVVLGSRTAHADVEQRMIRAATGAYLIFVSSHGGVILTPELRSPASWIPVAQFIAAVALIWRRTCVVAGAVILVLYGYAVAQYGIFHLTDYLFFPALAFYVGSVTIKPGRLAGAREPVLTAALAFSLAWTAIEKFLYPQWTYAVVASHPSIAFGLPVPFVVVVAGFVEFTLAFYLVTGRGLVRAGGAGYALIFVAAMPSFGRLDVYGHLIIITALLITVLRGETRLQRFWHRREATLAGDAAWITLVYMSVLLLFFAGYYALQTTAR